MHLEFQAETPDEKMELRLVDLGFHYDDAFGGQAIPDANERLLLDALTGDAALFTRSDEIEEVWRRRTHLPQQAMRSEADDLRQAIYSWPRTAASG